MLVAALEVVKNQYHENEAIWQRRARGVSEGL